MKLTPTQIKKLNYITKALAILILVFAIPFYFGYGNPLPFLNPDYTFSDNLWLSIFPLMFIGLITGLKYHKTGGYLITIPLTIGIILTIILEKELLWFMLIPLIVGIIYLILGYENTLN